MPFLIDTSLAGSLWDFAGATSASSDEASPEDKEGTSADLPVKVFGTPNGHARSDQFADDEEPLNRASRRAQQREDAQARRAQHR
jgi:hypothetical protein